MGSRKNKPQHLGGHFNTLAQSGTAYSDNYSSMPTALVYGNGADRRNKKRLENKAKRKFINDKLILALIDCAKEKGHSQRVQQYWNTYHCQRNLIATNDKVYGKYCKNRFCFGCSAIRKAEIINKYWPVISQWEKPYFLTLTVKAVFKEKLNVYFKYMKKAMRRTLDRCKKRYQRGKGPKLMGIISLECNFNAKNKTYNPHYHLILANREMAVTLQIEWQKTWNTKQKLAASFAQKSILIDNKITALIEVIKYGVKIFTEPDPIKKSNSKNGLYIYAKAYDTIFEAMQGNRLFGSFGFKLPKSINTRKSSAKILDSFGEWQYEANQRDWINKQTGELLTNFIASAQLQYLLDEHLDKLRC